MTSWSYSSISLFEQCPKKYFHLRVEKDIKEPTSEQMNYGLEVHKAAEDYISKDTPIPPQFSYMQEMLDKQRQPPYLHRPHYQLEYSLLPHR
jgi:hypothetical protein